MKKILLVDSDLDGHHVPYIQAILHAKSFDFVVALPKKTQDIEAKTVILPSFDCKSFSGYWHWLKALKQTIVQERPDIVHFVFGDCLYRFFGFGLRWLRKACPHLIATFHQIKPQRIAKVSANLILRQLSKMIVTTDYNFQALSAKAGRKVALNEIPHLYDFPIVEKRISKEKHGLPENSVVFGCIGILAEYKRIDLVIEAFKELKEENFTLIIAGRPEYYSEDFVKKAIQPIADKTKLFLQYLPGDLFFSLVNACDYILTPYSLNFNGASGPLTEAVWARKRIVSSDLRSLGYIVEQNDLGYVFKADDLQSFVAALKKALKDDYVWPEKAEAYRQKSSLDYFVKTITDIYTQE